MKTKNAVAMTDDELICLIRSNCRRGASNIYRCYAQALRLTISRILRDESLTEEVLQATFCKIWKCVHLYDASKGRVYTWMYRIARNLALDKLRSEAIHTRYLCRETMYDDPILLSGHIFALNVETFGIRSLVMLLNEDQRRIIQLQYLNGYTQKEIAELLEIPLGTVKTRCRLGLKTLREQF